MIPGLPKPTATDLQFQLLASENDVDIQAKLGSPSTRVTAHVFVASGVTIGSTSTSTPAMDLTGLASGSTVRLLNEGTIEGKGGDGGDGMDGIFSIQFGGLEYDFEGGGGGGGAGVQVGTGGAATGGATAGTNGTASAGGAAGANNTPASAASFKAGTAGGSGGTALACGAVKVTIYNGSGNIWGGGGGGAPGENFDDNGSPGSYAPGAGGDPGEAGAASTLDTGSDSGAGLLKSPGAAGAAVTGSAVTFESGSSSPNVKGSIP